MVCSEYTCAIWNAFCILTLSILFIQFYIECTWIVGISSTNYVYMESTFSIQTHVYFMYVLFGTLFLYTCTLNVLHQIHMYNWCIHKMYIDSQNHVDFKYALFGMLVVYLQYMNDTGQKWCRHRMYISQVKLILQYALF